MLKTKEYPLAVAGGTTLKTTWQNGYNNFTVILGDKTLGRFASQSELRKGRHFQLDKESTLFVKYRFRYLQPEILILLNGKPVTGTAADPSVGFKNAALTAAGLALLQIGGGLTAAAGIWHLPDEAGMSIHSVIFGVLYLLPAVLLLKKKPRGSALLLSLYLAEWLTTLGITIFTTDGAPSLTANVIRIFLLIPLAQGISAARQMKQNTLSRPAT